MELRGSPWVVESQLLSELLEVICILSSRKQAVLLALRVWKSGVCIGLGFCGGSDGYILHTLTLKEAGTKVTLGVAAIVPLFFGSFRRGKNIKQMWFS